MKRILILFILNILIIVLLLNSNFWKYSKESYLSEKVLDTSRPLDVTIDIGYLKSLSPAYD